MAMTLYAHPFASYCQKALIALYENDTPFIFHSIDLGDPASAAELAALWPFKKFPVLKDGKATLIEASIIVEHLDIHYRGAMCLLPNDPVAALQVRFLDRFFDNYIQEPMQRIVVDSLRSKDQRDALGVAAARTTIDTAYRWLDATMGDGRTWAAGDVFSLADCAAAPALFYADWTHPIPEACANVRAFRKRLNTRPSFARCIEEARPYRQFFPLGAPDKD